MKRTIDIPPCPDPLSYVLVQTKEGSFWRRKRGLGTKGVQLNHSFKISAEGMALTAPSAKRIVGKLKPFLDGLITGRITVRISGKLRKQYNKTGTIDYAYLVNMDLQPDYPLKKLLLAPVSVTVNKDVLNISVPVDYATIKKNSSLVTHYFFEVILISGDCTVNEGLRIESESSDVYPVAVEGQHTCSFSLALPDRSWFAVLKLSCIEGNEMAASPKNYGLKIVAIG